jgi:hypothetical protein
VFKPLGIPTLNVHCKLLMSLLNRCKLGFKGMAQESRAIGQEKAQVGGSTPEIAQAKAKAANEIASDTATKITSGVSDAMRDLRATGPETARGFREQSQEAARQVGAGQAEVVNQLNTSNQQTGSGIQQAVTQGSQALGNLGTQLTGQLASLEQTIQNQLQTQIAQKSQEIYQAGQQAITTFQQQGQQAIASGDEHLAQFNQQLAGMDVDPDLAPKSLEKSSVKLMELMTVSSQPPMEPSNRQMVPLLKLEQR